MDDDFPTFQELVEGTPALRDLLRDMMAMRGPKNERIQFRLKPGQRTYRYLEGPRGEMYCWTPHKSTEGWYYAYTMQPYGKGSRSGNPTQWRARQRVRYRKRISCKQTAVRRYLKAGGRDPVGDWQEWLDG